MNDSSWNQQLVPRRNPHAHLVHPSPVRAHSYPFATFSGAGLHASSHPSALALQAWSLSASSSAGDASPTTTVRSSHSYSHSHHSHSYSYAHSTAHSHSHPSLSASSLHHLPSPPLSTSAMPDPWTAERVSDPEDDMHPWGLNGSAAGLPPVGIPPKAEHAPQPVVPRSPRTPNGRPLSPMSKKLLAPVALEVWAAVLDKSKGRDKILKTIQYTLRSYLYVLGLIAGVRPLSKLFYASQKRSKIATAGLSLTRKCLLLFNPLRPIGALLSPEPTSARAFLAHLVDLVGAISDDVLCLSKLGLVSKRKGLIADTWGNRVWFYSTIMGLYGLWVKQGTRRTESEKKADALMHKKYLCDLVFVSYDIFNLSWMKEPVQCFVGLSAALISTSQLYQKDYIALAKR